MGWSAGNTLAEPGIEFLTERAWLRLGQGLRETDDAQTATCWIRRPISTTSPFVLFAFSWRHGR